MKKTGPPLGKLRYAVQAWFLLFSLYAGFMLFRFALHFERAGFPYVERVPSVEGFLPIAGLMSFKYFLLTATAEPFHPAALALFIGAAAVSLVMKKGFCGWVCPVGTVSQYFWMAGEKAFGRNRRILKYIDIPLRAVKYILMAMFVWFIFIRMSPDDMRVYFLEDYYKTADIRTMKFFTEMSSGTFRALFAIGALSLLYKNFWCRYLCPYGALLGLLSLAGPARVSRNEERCVHCGACAKNCPTLIDVEKKNVVNSPECFGCLTCVSRCPSKGALQITAGYGKKRKAFNPLMYPAALLLIFYLIIGAAMLTGHWKSAVAYEDYARIIPEISGR